MRKHLIQTRVLIAIRLCPLGYVMSSNFPKIDRWSLQGSYWKLCKPLAYVDGILVKLSKIEEHPRDLNKTLDTLRTYGMKLNLAKCQLWNTRRQVLEILHKEKRNHT